VGETRVLFPRAHGYTASGSFGSLAQLSPTEMDDRRARRRNGNDERSKSTDIPGPTNKAVDELLTRNGL